MPRPLYCFSPKNQMEVDSPTGKQYLFSSDNHEGWHSLGGAEYELASLFNGQRSEDQIREMFCRAQSLSLSRDDLTSFIAKLLEIELLRPVDEPVRLDPADLGGVDPATLTQSADGNSGHLDEVTPIYSEEIPDHEEAIRPASRGARRPRESYFDSRRHSTRPSPVVIRAGGSAAPEEIDLGEPGFAPREEELGAAPGWTASPIPPDIPHAEGAAQSPQRKAKPRGPKWLLRLPVRWLLPLATPLAWAAWSRNLAILLGITLVGVGTGLWLTRTEFARDLVAWAAPLTLIQSILLGLVTVNLFPQLARAAEFERRTGESAPFGIRLAYRLLPYFAADISGLASLKQVEGRRAVIGAHLSAIATICLGAYFGWFLTKNNGTTLPLVCLGVAILATLRLLMALNPLGRSDGYFLLALSSGTPDLKERAFVTLLATLLGKTLPPGWATSVPRWALVSYALAVITYMIAIMVLLTIAAGGWLEKNWGGFGVVLFLAIATLVLWDPVRDARARLETRRARRAPAEERTVASRAWSMLKLAVVLGGLTFLALIPYRYEPGGEFVLRPLQASRTDVRALISGRVDHIPVKEGDYVTAGQLLARLSGDEERKNVEGTEATLRERAAQLEKAISGATQEQIAAARQKVSSAKTRHEFSRSRADRYEQLRNSGFSSPQEYEGILAQAESDREALMQAEKDLDQLLAGTRQEEIDALRASIDLQSANLVYYRQQQQYAEIRAPITGYIVSGSLLTAQGSYLKNGDLFATIEDRSKLLAEIRVPQFDIGFVRIGAPIRLRAWTQPDLEIQGLVQSVAPSVEETPSGRMVRVTSELENENGQLKSGLTGFAKVEGEEMMSILAFTRVIIRFFHVTLWSWLP